MQPLLLLREGGVSQAPLLTRTGNVTYSSVSAAATARQRIGGSLMNPGNNLLPAATARPVAFCPTPRRSGGFHQPVGYRTPRSSLAVPPVPSSPRSAISTAMGAAPGRGGVSGGAVDRGGGGTGGGSHAVGGSAGGSGVGGNGGRRGSTSPEVIDALEAHDFDDVAEALALGALGGGGASTSAATSGSTGGGGGGGGSGPDRRIVGSRQPSDIQEAEEPLLELW